MKGLLLLAILIVSLVGDALSQAYTPFPKSNAIWRCRREHAVSPTESIAFDYQLMLNGKDTIINADTFKVIMIRSKTVYYSSSQASPSYENLVADGPDQFYGAIRESNKKIYFYYPAPLPGIDSSLLYDFNLQVGDTVPPAYWYPGITTSYITGVDSMQFNGTYRKVFLTTHGKIAEGIGNLSGGLYANMPFPGTIWMYCFTVSDTTIYTRTGYTCSLIDTMGSDDIAEINDDLMLVSIFPNPFSEFVGIAFSSSLKINRHLFVFDMYGRKIFEESFDDAIFEIDKAIFPAKGIYFVEIMEGSIKHREKIIFQ